MSTRVAAGLVVVLFAGGFLWQQSVIRRLQSDTAQLAKRQIEVPAPMPLETVEPARHTDHGAAVESLQLRIAALEARVQALTAELERESKRQQEVVARGGPAEPVPPNELKARILDPKFDVRERFNAFRALVGKGLLDAQTTAAFVEEVTALNDEELTGQLFRALDNTGNLAAAPALIKGLQSDKVELRMRALDALSEMQSDATVVQWMQHVARNDRDERVRAEAVRVLAQSGNQP